MGGRGESRRDSSHPSARWAGFVGDSLAGIDTISHIPAVLLHGRQGLSSALRTARDLHTAWPVSRPRILEHEGHGGAAMGDEIRAAIAKLGASL